MKNISRVILISCVILVPLQSYGATEPETWSKTALRYTGNTIAITQNVLSTVPYWTIATLGVMIRMAQAVQTKIGDSSPLGDPIIIDELSSYKKILYNYFVPIIGTYATYKLWQNYFPVLFKKICPNCKEGSWKEYWARFVGKVLGGIALHKIYNFARPSSWDAIIELAKAANELKAK